MDGARSAARTIQNNLLDASKQVSIQNSNYYYNWPLSIICRLTFRSQSMFFFTAARSTVISLIKQEYFYLQTT